MEKKRCLIHANMPITCFSVPIIGHVELRLTSDEIYKCLCSKAEIQEILSNGKMINLDFTNYNTDNNKKEITTKEVAEEVKIEEPEITEEVLDETVEKSDDIEDSKEEMVEEKLFNESLTKTHQLQSRNNTKNKKNKNRR